MNEIIDEISLFPERALTLLTSTSLPRPERRAWVECVIFMGAIIAGFSLAAVPREASAREPGARLSSSFLGQGPADQAADTQPLPAGLRKVNHIIWIMQENRTIDNYFGTFPGADGIPPSTCLSKLPCSKECVEPYHMPGLFPTCDLPHEWEHAHAAYDSGRMDAFVWVEGTPYTMGYLDKRDIPNYWTNARHYTLCDAQFSSQMGESLTNHLYMVSAQSGDMIGGAETVEEVEKKREMTPVGSALRQSSICLMKGASPGNTISRQCLRGRMRRCRRTYYGISSILT